MDDNTLIAIIFSMTILLFIIAVIGIAWTLSPNITWTIYVDVSDRALELANVTRGAVTS
jgi:uncharacterized membrane protein YqjE